MEARPKSLLSDFVAAGNLQFVEALKEFHDGLQAPVADVAASEDEAVNAGGTMWEILDESMWLIFSLWVHIVKKQLTL